jgi:UDP-N-acetylmuramoyl-tripeptide--D-alanyl-D-alanine ligase
MRLITAAELIDAVRGKLVSGAPGTVFTGVSIDSRTVRKGDLFVAIVGKRLDGHSFVSEAVAKGAAGAIVSRWDSAADRKSNAVLVVVDDTTKALQNLAKWHRRRFSCSVAAITGSNGKTTTKDLAWAILSRDFRTVRNEGSKNNHIGLPVTLLELDEETEAVVAELGTSGWGEIRELISICSPDIGCITNIGPAHLEFFGSIANVARAKAELLEGMRDGCPVVLNADDEWFEWLRGEARGPVVTFGIYHPADFMAEDIHIENEAVTFRMVANLLGRRRYVHLPFAGTHNVYNALAAATIASQFGVGMPKIKEGLAAARLPSMRYEVRCLDGLTVINDAYNANPVSTMSALSSFCEMNVDGKKIFVCGDMLELGKHALEAHRQVGFFIASQPIDYVITLGELASAVGEAAFRGRPGGERWVRCRSVEEVVDVLMDVASPGDAVLIKGSRANGMERIVEALEVGAFAGSREDARR